MMTAKGLKRLTNYDFVQAMKNINPQTSKAFDLYNRINEPKNNYAISKMLKICSVHPVCPSQIEIIWNDILQTRNIQNISAALIGKAISNSLKRHQSTQDINVCIQILQTLLIKHCECKKNANIHSVLINAFGIASKMEEAMNTFNGISSHQMDSVCIGSLMKAMIKNHHYKQALFVYDQYGQYHDHVLHLLAIKICAKLSEFELGKSIIDKHRLLDDKDIKLKSALIDFYGACNDLNAAKDIYESIEMNRRDIVSTCCMMSCYLKNNENDECIKLYKEQMNRRKNDVCQLLALKACINSSNIAFGNQIIQKVNNMSHCSLELKATMISFYLSIKDIKSAISAFESIPMKEKNAVQLQMIMNSCSYEETLSIYQKHTTLHNDDIHLLAIQAAMSLDHFECGKDIIKSIKMTNFTKIELLNTMIDFYGKLGDIQSALHIFETTQKKTIVTINVMMNAYCDNQMNTECMQLFKAIVFDNAYNNLKPDHITVATALKACIHKTALAFGEEIHSYLKEHHNDQNDILHSLDVQINLICLYGKSKRLQKCEEIFEEIKQNEYEKYCSQIMLWHSMFHAYGRNKKMDAMLTLFNEMQKETSIKATDKTYCILLNACSVNEDHKMSKYVWNNYIYIKGGDDYAQITESDIYNLSKTELMQLLDVFVLCLRVKWRIFSYSFTEKFCMLPALQMISGSCYKFKEVMTTVKGKNDDQNKEFIRFMIEQFKSRFGQKFGNKDWLQVIDAFGLMEDSVSMITEYNSMLMTDLKVINSNIIVVLLHHCLRNGEPQYVEDVWRDLLDNQHRISLNPLVLQSLMLCVNRTSHHHQSNILSQMWNFFVERKQIKPNLECLCLTILSFSKYRDAHNRSMAEKLLLELQSDETMLCLLGSNQLAFNQILTSYGNLNELDKMWGFYEQYVDEWAKKHNIVSLTVLNKFETRKAQKNDILSILDEHFDLKNATIDHLIGFHRTAKECENGKIEEKIKNILDRKGKIKTNVVASFQLNGKSYQIPNGYDGTHLIDELMKEIDYKINTSICTEIPLEYARERHLKNHAEKKALAICLKNGAAKNKNIRIKVTMKMCADCHEFFCQISRKYSDHKIECVDPTGIHSFKGGICYLCA